MAVGRVKKKEFSCFFFFLSLSHFRDRTKERNKGVKSTPIGGVSDVNDLRPSFHRYLCISTDGGCPRRLRFTKSARWACEIGDNFHQSSEAMAIQPVSVPEFNSIASDPFNFRKVNSKNFQIFFLCPLCLRLIFIFIVIDI